MRSEKQIRLSKKAMIEALEKTLGIVTQACKLVGVSRDSHYRWIKEDPEYKKNVDEVENIVLDFAESKLHKAMNEDNVTATIFFLKTRGKCRGYIEKQEMELSGEVTGAPVITFGNTTKEEDDAEE